MKHLGIGIMTGMLCLMFNSCSKEELIEKTVDQPLKRLTQTEQTFLDFANRKLAEVSVQNRDVIDPKNFDNFMDEFGKSFETMIIHLNAEEAVNPSSTKEEYLGKISAYQENNPMRIGALDFVDPGTEFYEVLAGLIKETGGKDDAALAVEQLKALESLLKDTELLSELEKTYLLAFSAAIKYMKSTVKNHGLQIGEINIDDFDSARMPCFDRVFNQTAKENLSVLADWGSPVLAFGAWASLPGTLGYGVGDALYQAIVGC